MARGALAERRPWLTGSIIAALAYYLLDGGPSGGLYLIALKGAAFILLGIYAVLRHPGAATRYLAAMAIVAAAGHMAAELDRHVARLFFYAGDLIALVLFLGNRRLVTTTSQRRIAAMLLLIPPLAGLAVTQNVGGLLVMLVPGAMAGAAWISSFPRARTGVGAAMIVAAQWLALLAGDRAEPSIVYRIAYWPLSYLGLLLIVNGVVLRLRRDHRA